MGFSDRKNKRNSGFRSEGRDEFRGSKTLTKVICSSCGCNCQVPFKPISGKPVYCNDCFGKNNSDYSNDRPSRFSTDRSSRFNSDPGSSRYSSRDSERRSSVSLEDINAKLERILRLLED